MSEPLKLSLKRRIKYLMEYGVVLFFAWLLRVLPEAQASGLGKNLGRTVQKLLPQRLDIGRDNIVKVFPGISEAEVQRILRGCWENLGHAMADFVRLPDLSAEALRGLADVRGMEHLRRSYAAGRGVVLATAHYGAWEIGTKLFPDAGFNFAVVARRVKNPHVHDWMTRIRSAHGTRVILSRDAVRESVRWLKAGNLLAVLVDHRISEGGLQIPFLGRPALTTSMPAVLALRYQIPIHPTHCWRENEKVIVQIGPALDFSDLIVGEEGIVEATLRINRQVEQWIQARPEAWLWIHNRWKLPPVA